VNIPTDKVTLVFVCDTRVSLYLTNLTGTLRVFQSGLPPPFISLLPGQVDIKQNKSPVCDDAHSFVRGHARKNNPLVMEEEFLSLCCENVVLRQMSERERDCAAAVPFIHFGFINDLSLLQNGDMMGH